MRKKRRDVKKGVIQMRVDINIKNTLMVGYGLRGFSDMTNFLITLGLKEAMQAINESSSNPLTHLRNIINNDTSPTTGALAKNANG